jgi:restriction endonuclease Mrr
MRDWTDTNQTAVTAELLRRLRLLDYAAFELAVCRLLQAMGYDRPRLLGRTRLRGHNRGGGADIEAFARTGVTLTRVLVRAKQYGGPVPARHVDELRGALAREGAGMGLIVSTGGFSLVAAARAEAGAILPVRLVDGGALAALLIRHGLGVRPGLVLDERFFAGLRSAADRPMSIRNHFS